ncbi:rhodanese-like domain-containing protein [Photobacterium leiognathi]|uniref:rhodanese-like domain-containing protein n=1 Tax=Photobacterium leiognathi TaxID=553611 RepID=UPI002980A9A6|nr:rhodanese-like domain-containing protein [Photobacterium leiognathi]
MMKKIRRLTALLFAFFPAISFAKNVTPDEFWQIEKAQQPLIIDVRTPEEFSEGHLANAINIPFDQITTIENYLTDKSKPILLYCRSGRRAELAENTLYTLGYKETFNGMSYQLLQKAKPKD